MLKRIQDQHVPIPRCFKLGKDISYFYFGDIKKLSTHFWSPLKGCGWDFVSNCLLYICVREIVEFYRIL